MARLQLEEMRKASTSSLIQGEAEGDDIESEDEDTEEEIAHVDSLHLRRKKLEQMEKNRAKSMDDGVVSKNTSEPLLSVPEKIATLSKSISCEDHIVRSHGEGEAIRTPQFLFDSKRSRFRGDLEKRKASSRIFNQACMDYRMKRDAEKLEEEERQIKLEEDARLSEHDLLRKKSFLKSLYSSCMLCGKPLASDADVKCPNCHDPTEGKKEGLRREMKKKLLRVSQQGPMVRSAPQLLEERKTVRSEGSKPTPYWELVKEPRL